MRPSKQPMKWAVLTNLVMPGLVPGIHVLPRVLHERRGWPGQARPWQKM